MATLTRGPNGSDVTWMLGDRNPVKVCQDMQFNTGQDPCVDQSEAMDKFIEAWF